MLFFLTDIIKNKLFLKTQRTQLFWTYYVSYSLPVVIIIVMKLVLSSQLNKLILTKTIVKLSDAYMCEVDCVASKMWLRIECKRWWYMLRWSIVISWWWSIWCQNSETFFNCFNLFYTKHMSIKQINGIIAINFKYNMK